MLGSTQRDEAAGGGAPEGETTQRDRGRKTKTATTRSIPRGKFLTVADLAEILSCSKATVRRAVASGTLPAPITLGLTQLKRWHPGEVAEALGLDVADLPEPGE